MNFIDPNHDIISPDNEVLTTPLPVEEELYRNNALLRVQEAIDEVKHQCPRVCFVVMKPETFYKVAASGRSPDGNFMPSFLGIPVFVGDRDEIVFQLPKLISDRLRGNKA